MPGKTKQDYEAEGRFDKAHKLARAARRMGVDHETMARWDDSQWETLTALARLKKLPSERTRGMAIGFVTPSAKPRKAETL